MEQANSWTIPSRRGAHALVVWLSVVGGDGAVGVSRVSAGRPGAGRRSRARRPKAGDHGHHSFRQPANALATRCRCTRLCPAGGQVPCPLSALVGAATRMLPTQLRQRRPLGAGRRTVHYTTPTREKVPDPVARWRDAGGIGGLRLTRGHTRGYNPPSAGLGLAGWRVVWRDASGRRPRNRSRYGRPPVRPGVRLETGPLPGRNFARQVGLNRKTERGRQSPHLPPIARTPEPP
jgi:hypothetical protein